MLPGKSSQPQALQQRHEELEQINKKFFARRAVFPVSNNAAGAMLSGVDWRPGSPGVMAPLHPLSRERLWEERCGTVLVGISDLRQVSI